MGLVHPDRVLTNGGATDGDSVVLCKPIGTGVALLGLKAGLLAPENESILLHSLTMLNKEALAVASAYKISACTDVTGFGLIGHLHEMAKASGLQARLQAQQVPLLPQVFDLAAQGFVPAGAYGNRTSFEKHSYINEVDLALSDLFFDPQTSGGLLFALPATQADALVRDLCAHGLNAAQIGGFEKGTPGMVQVIGK
jgi:selenide,water dikinase